MSPCTAMGRLQASGEIEGYIREDLLVSGEEAQQLFESVHGDGEITGAQPLDAVISERTC